MNKVVAALWASQLLVTWSFSCHSHRLGLMITAKCSLFGPQTPIICVLCTLYLRGGVNKESHDTQPTPSPHPALPHKISFLRHWSMSTKPTQFMLLLSCQSSRSYIATNYGLNTRFEPFCQPVTWLHSDGINRIDYTSPCAHFFAKASTWISLQKLSRY